MFPRLHTGRARPVATLLIAVIGTAVAAFGEESKDYRFLGGEHPRFTGYEGHALRRVIPLDELPPSIGFESGKLSLVPDPTDASGIYMVVYLVNDTDQPVPYAVGENQTVHSEMKIAGHWLSRDPMVFGCGSVPRPENLPPRRALALGARRAGLGDTDGLIRYSFPIADLFSQPMPGRYESAQADWALSNETRSYALQEAFWIGAEKETWEGGEIARDPEDFAALLEIVRHHRLCVVEKRQIDDWIQKQRQQPALEDDFKRALDRMEETLWKAWIHHDDSQAMVDRCVAALEARQPGEFGTPERCEGVIWRYLCHGEVAKAVGETDARSQTKLLKLAETALAGSNHSARNGAALFMARRTGDGEFPTTRFHGFLESGVTEICRAGLEGLTRRGKANEAGPWMLRQYPDNPSLCSYYGILRHGLRGEMLEWEVEIMKRLLDHQATEALSVISSYPRGDSATLPALCETPLRQALARELEPTRKAWWKAEAEEAALRTENAWGRYSAYSLSDGIRQLDQFSRAEDTGLFAGFLEHPASNFTYRTDGTRIEHFTAREAAKAALLKRHIPLVAEVAIKIEFAPPGGTEVLAPPEKVTGWHGSPVMYGLLAAACLVGGLWFWKTRKT